MRSAGAFAKAVAVIRRTKGLILILLA